jgi:hypothetical protein
MLNIDVASPSSSGILSAAEILQQSAAFTTLKTGKQDNLLSLALCVLHVDNAAVLRYDNPRHLLTSTNCRGADGISWSPPQRKTVYAWEE